jgi:hypothetical protein
MTIQDLRRLWPLSGLMRLPRVLGAVHKRVCRERDSRDEDSDILTAPGEELELAGETLSRLDTQVDNAHDDYEHVAAGGLGVGGSATAYLTADETWHDEKMPLASLAPAVEIRLQPSHSGA